jgi:acyl-CoA synthetase (AMP-forming)/AMP-acid ligase II
MPLREAVQVPDDSDAVIIFTGGTTATPKGVRLSHSALRAYLSSINVFMDRYSVKNYVADTPQQILYGLYLGIGVWIPGGRGKRRAEGIAKCLSRGGAQMFFGPPFIWNQLLDRAAHHALPAPANLRLVLLGGAPVSDALLTRLQSWLAASTEVRVLYGLTEIGPVCSCTAESRLCWTGQGNLVGAAMPGVQMTIVDPGPDGTGELELRGPSVYSGYVGQGSSGGVLRTGDLARVVEYAGDQQLVLMGRRKDMIIRRGVNIYPATLEPLILQATDHSGQALLSDCSLVGVWNTATQDEEVFLFYVPAPAQKVDPGWLRERLSNLHGAELAPDLCVPIDKIPEVGRQHKPDKRALRARAEQMRSGSTQELQIDLPAAGYGREIEK